MYREPGVSKKRAAVPLLKVLGKEAHPETGADYNTKIKAMALEISENTVPDHFSSVILYADKITEKFGSWLEKYLVKNGNLVHIYSGLGHASRYYDENNRILEKHGVTEDRHFSYYEVYREDGVVSLFPFPGEDNYHIIDLVKTRAGLSSASDKAVFPPEQSVCIDKDKSDAMGLHMQLVNLSSKSDPVEHLMSGPVIPYLSSICRWNDGPTNCERLDTVIVDKGYDVKTCWNGRPVGKVGMSYRKIAENLEHIRREAKKARGCQSCERKASCTKCIFPAPLSGGEYCHLQKYVNTGHAAGLVRNLNMLKEM